MMASLEQNKPAQAQAKVQSQNQNQNPDYRDVWVYVQRDGDRLSREALEILAAGRKVADKLGQKLVAVMLGYNLADLPLVCLQYGADSVIYADSDQLADRLNLKYVDFLERLVRERRPYAFLFVADELGKDLAPRLAYRLKTGLATDNIELEVGDFVNPRLNETYKNLVIQIRPDFGTRVAKIYTPKHRPQMATIRPGNFRPLERMNRVVANSAEKLQFLNTKTYRAVVKEIAELPKPKVELRDAQVIISLGLGVLKDAKGNPRNPREAYDMADELRNIISSRFGVKAEIGVTRALLYAEIKELSGLVIPERQVGQTGATVQPDVYIALGISGALQHRVGMQKSKKIVAVNIDPNAPIFQIAHYPIVGDLYEFLPEMISRLKRVG
ncbi:MAG: electron transfer flavoprotein subunit alpha/FixB family protein [Conexivisphaerales archaeon]